MSDTLTDIADAAEALCDARQHAEPRYEWDANRNKKPIAPHRTIVPGLIQQLRDLAEEGSASGDETGVRSVPDSRPPGEFDAVALIAAVTFGAAWRAGQLGLQPRDTAEANIRAIVGAASSIDSDTQRDIRHELTSWRRQADVILGWEQPPIELVAPCPIVDTDGAGTPCGARGSLLAQRDGTGARCVKCGAAWDERDVALLFEHVKRYTEASKAAAEKARRVVREQKAEQRRLLEEAKKRRAEAA
ncbi:DUF7341 domain-containing protein [Dactylosporangium sp. CA-139066]|uniref:DUF7341 domain-containing protein n=1 Tax=Dactylosporangium sp. CA-139066 TaxID=3239930 RepID=UPI003D90E3CA